MIVSQPPSEAALEQSLVMVATTVKWAGTVEASPVRHAHLLAPGDWIVCAQSSVRDLSPPYAMFFNGDRLVHYRIAVEIDDCRRAPYAPAAAAVPGGQPAASASSSAPSAQCSGAARRSGRAIVGRAKSETSAKENKGGTTMTHQDNGHPFDRRLFLAGTSALALLAAERRRVRAEEGGKAAARTSGCGRCWPSSSSASISSRCRRR